MANCSVAQAFGNVSEGAHYLASGSGVHEKAPFGCARQVGGPSPYGRDPITPSVLVVAKEKCP